MGKLIGDVATNDVEGQQRRRDKLRALRPEPSSDLSALDAEVMAARIMMSVPVDKADRIAAALNQRLVLGRVGTLDSGAHTPPEARLIVTERSAGTRYKKRSDRAKT
jgi:hypothetical protein